MVKPRTFFHINLLGWRNWPARHRKLELTQALRAGRRKKQNAQVVKLVDTQRSERCSRERVRVQVSSWAQ